MSSPGEAGRSSSPAGDHPGLLDARLRGHDKSCHHGSKSWGASSRPPKSKPGATVQPSTVHAPRPRALCQACAGTAACGARLCANRGRAGIYAAPRFEQEWRPARLPKLGRIDLVPARNLARLHQEQDRGRVRPAVRPCRVAERLAEPTPFRMRLEVMLPDHVLGGQYIAHERRHALEPVLAAPDLAEDLP